MPLCVSVLPCALWGHDLMMLRCCKFILRLSWGKHFCPALPTLGWYDVECTVKPSASERAMAHHSLGRWGPTNVSTPVCQFECKLSSVQRFSGEIFLCFVYSEAQITFRAILDWRCAFRSCRYYSMPKYTGYMSQMKYASSWTLFPFWFG